MENDKQENNFLNELINDVWIIGNHHSCGILKETYEKRGNELLAKTKKYLSDNPDIPIQEKVSIKCWQFWIVGFLSGQTFNVYEENIVDFFL